MKLLLASTPRKEELRPSAKTRTAKSSALINKTLELHIMPPTVCRRVAVFLLRSYTNTCITHKTHTHTHTRISFSPSLRPFLSLVESAFKSAWASYRRTREIATLSACLSISFYSRVAATSSW